MIEPQVGLFHPYCFAYSEACVQHQQGDCVVADSLGLELGCAVPISELVEELFGFFGG